MYISIFQIFETSVSATRIHQHQMIFLNKNTLKLKWKKLDFVLQNINA
jgi:hypothetical protein